MSAVSGRPGPASPWDPISPGSSRRSSEAGARGAEQGAAAARVAAADHGARMSPLMSHHLSKLHKKAVAAGTTSSLVQVDTYYILISTSFIILGSLDFRSYFFPFPTSYKNSFGVDCILNKDLCFVRYNICMYIFIQINANLLPIF